MQCRCRWCIFPAKPANEDLGCHEPRSCEWSGQEQAERNESVEPLGITRVARPHFWPGTCTACARTTALAPLCSGISAVWLVDPYRYAFAVGASQHRRRVTIRRRRVRLGAVVVTIGVAITAVVLAQGGGTSRAVPPPSTGTRPVSTAPKPTTKSNGPFAVGTTELSLVEAAAPGSKPRSIPTVVRYPSLGVAGGSEHPGADPDRTNGPYPLVVFSSGFDIAPEAYATLMESWATAGYVVVDPTYPLTDPGSPAGVDEADIVNHPADLRFVITNLLQASEATGGPLSGLIDASHVAVVGHSDGGDVSLATAANSCCRDPRVKAAIILSGAELSSFGGTYYGSGSVPLFVVQGTNDILNPPACSVQLFNAAPPPKYYLSLLGAGHEPPYLQPGTDQSVVQKATADFLDGYLKASAVALAALTAIGSASSQIVLSTAPSLRAVSGQCPGAPSA